MAQPSAAQWLAGRAWLAYLPPLLALTVYVLRWSLNPDNYFFADDWNWLNDSANAPVGKWLHLFPTFIYNDRPAGALLIRGLYSLFGLNQVAFHTAFLGIHLLNVVLAFFLGRRLLGSDTAAFCSSVLFGCWGSALQAPTWVGSAFDLLCGTFTLAAILAHIAGKSAWLTAALFVAAIRSKEFALLIPALLLAGEAILPENWSRDGIRRVFRAYAPLWIAAGIYGVVYLVLYVRYPLPASNPYRLTLTRGAFTSGIEFYLGTLLYFPYLGGMRVILFLGALAASLALRWRAESIGLLGFLLFLAPVLFLPEHHGALYLYAPSAFFWIAAVGFAVRALAATPIRSAAGRLLIVITLAAILWQYQSHYLSIQAWSLDNFRIFRQNLEQLRRIAPAPDPKTRLFISGLPPYMNVFDWGPCDSVRLIYHQNGMDCILYKSPEETRKLFDAYDGPKLLLSYGDGQLKALK